MTIPSFEIDECNLFQQKNIFHAVFANHIITLDSKPRRMEVTKRKPSRDCIANKWDNVPLSVSPEALFPVEMSILDASAIRYNGGS